MGVRVRVRVRFRVRVKVRAVVGLSDTAYDSIIVQYI
jgi:hypothetical protein